MGKLIKALKNLGSKLNGSEPSGKYVSEVIDNVANDFANGTTATKEYVNSLMSGALKRTIVEALPEEDIDTNTIYMVLDETASQQGNVYNEYLYINNAWELIGTTEVAETVVANPTLAGTEADLTGLQVGNIKYKVPQGSGGTSNTIIDYDLYNKINSNNYTISVANLKQLLADLGINLNNNFETINIAVDLITVALSDDEDQNYYIQVMGDSIVSVSSLIMNRTFNNVLNALGNGTFSTISLPINAYGVYALSIKIGDNYYPITKAQLLNLFVEQQV